MSVPKLSRRPLDIYVWRYERDEWAASSYRWLEAPTSRMHRRIEAREALCREDILRSGTDRQGAIILDADESR